MTVEYRNKKFKLRNLSRLSIGDFSKSGNLCKNKKIQTILFVSSYKNPQLLNAILFTCTAIAKKYVWSPLSVKSHSASLSTCHLNLR